MAIIAAFLLVLLPANTQAPFHSLFQCIAILCAGVVLFSRNAKNLSNTPAASITPFPTESKYVLKTETSRQASLINPQNPTPEQAVEPSDSPSSDSNWSREIAAWLVLVACLLPFANYVCWLDTPRSVAACRVLAALGLFWFAAANGRRYAASHLTGAALLASGLFILTSLVFPGLPAWLPRFSMGINTQSPILGNSGAGFPTLCYLIIILLPVMLVTGIYQIREKNSIGANSPIKFPASLRLPILSLGCLLLTVWVMGLGSIKVILVMVLACLVAVLWFIRRQSGWKRLHFLWVAIPVILVLGLHGTGIFHRLFPWPAHLWPVESAHQPRLILDAAPWGAGLGSYELALQRYSRLTTVASDWWGGWIRGISTLGVLSIAHASLIALIVYFMTIKQSRESRIATVALPALLVLLLSGALVGWEFITTSPLGWLCLGMLAGALPDRAQARLPQRLRIAYGFLAFMLLITILLSGSASLAISSARSLETADPSNGEAIASRYRIASLLAPWDPESARNTYEWTKQSIPETYDVKDRARGIVQARHALRRALRLSPAHPDLSLALAAEYAETGETGMVLQSLNEAVEHHPDDARLYVSLGECLEGLGNDDLALESWRKAANLEPDNPGHRLAMARLLNKAGKTGEAIKEYQKVQWLDYNNEEARRMLGELTSKVKE